MAPDAPEEAAGTALTYRDVSWRHTTRRSGSGRSPSAVVHTARRHWWRILAVSIVVSAVTVAVELAADHLLDRADLTSAVVGAVSTSTVSLLGAVFLSGFLCRLVSTTEHGATEHGTSEHGTSEAGADKHEGDGSRIRDVLRSLPWGSLILADLLAALIVVVGLVALIIPGLIAITLLAVVGPVIELERQHAVAGLRRSAHLVRPHFWRVAAYATLPLLVANGVVGFLPDPSGRTDVVTTLIVRSIGEGVVESVVGLLLVELCYRLIAADRAAAHPAAQPVGLPERARRGRLRLVVPPGEGRLGLAARDQRGQGGRETAAGGLPRDAFRVLQPCPRPAAPAPGGPAGPRPAAGPAGPGRCDPPTSARPGSAADPACAGRAARSRRPRRARTLRPHPRPPAAAPPSPAARGSPGECPCRSAR